MNLIFVDYENVSSKGLEGIDKLTKDSKVYLFYSDNVAHLPMKAVIAMNESKAKIEFIHTNTGKNSLDFILASVLGFVIHERNEEDTYCIVSSDKGFEVLLDYWKNSNIVIKMITSITQILTKNNTINTKAALNDFEKEILHKNITSQIDVLLKNETKELRKKIIDIIVKCKSKKAVKNSIKQIVQDNNKVEHIYKKISNLLVDKKT